MDTNEVITILNGIIKEQQDMLNRKDEEIQKLYNLVISLKDDHVPKHNEDNFKQLVAGKELPYKNPYDDPFANNLGTRYPIYPTVATNNRRTKK